MAENNFFYIVESSDEFFTSSNPFRLNLSLQAALDVCQKAIHHGMVVSTLGGGINKGYALEQRNDCIWIGKNSLVTIDDALKNNQEAAAFIINMQGENDVFYLGVKKIDKDQKS